MSAGKQRHMVKTGFIGAGVVGTVLAVSLSQKGSQVSVVASRSFPSAQRLAGRISGCRALHDIQEVADVADLVFITTPDSAIPLVASHVHWHQGQSVVHCSGADSLDVLEPARQAGARAGSFHPLQAFAGLEQALKNISGTTFALEAEEPLLSQLKALASLLDGEWIELRPGDKVRYHASAVFVSNYLVTLVRIALDLWQSFGVSRDQATRALLPLIQGTVGNIEKLGLPQCLTGPIARGDLTTIDKHIEALRAQDERLLSVYREMGLSTIPIALAKGGIDEQRAAEMKARFSPVKSHER